MMDLQRLIDDLWTRLEGVPAHPGHPWRTPALATVSREGFPAVRTVVLRRVEVSQSVLIAHTDLRSPKVEELRIHPVAEWLFYDPGIQVQLRLRGRTEIVTSGNEYVAGWEATPGPLRPNYGSPKAPGAPLEETFFGQPVDEEFARGNFALLRSGIEQVDWLQLNSTSHLRAQFVRQGGDWIGEWIVP